SMKKLTFSIIAAASLLFTSCSEEAKEITYKLDKGTSLEWTGKYVADGHTHSGTVAVSDGEMTFKGEEFVKGSFTVDMKTIVNTDGQGEEKQYLETHLNGPDFFNTGKFSKAKVTIDEVTDKEMKATIDVVGKKIKAVMPVKMNKTETNFNAEGTFEVDFAETSMNGFKAAPNDPADQHTDTKIAFKLSLKMKK
ncbi:MAG: YceI family protein, partial [Flavobacteriia bacterium]